PASLRPLPRPPRPVRLPVAATSVERVGLFVGCVAQAYENPLRAATARLCAALAIELDPVPGQGCCGALHEHNGNLASAQRLGAANRAAFVGQRTVLTLASGCHDAVAHALADGARTVDALSFLAERAASLTWRATPERVALHLPCTQRNVVKSVPALRRLLASVPGLEVFELDAGYGCCGASGTQMLADPQRAAEYRAPLIEQFARSGATRLLSANIGCRLHLANGTTMPVLHPLEFLAQCLDTAPADPLR
ncbi:MAG: (Fe-S)-binding protein, partial [Lysobacter sp.]